MINNSIVERFCTPVNAIENESDKKILENSKVEDFCFEETNLRSYSWGEGQNILLVHGWNSKASHLAFLGRNLAKSGFHVLAFDGPAHGNSLKTGRKNVSSMFEFCRSIKFMADKLHPLYAVIGHSLGATAAAFTALGHERLSEYKIMPERLAMISPLAGIARMLDHYCRNNGLVDNIAELKESLENQFEFSTENFYLPDVLGNIKPKLLIIHDENDEEIPVSDAFTLKNVYPDAELFITKGLGHQRILINREVLRKLNEFLM